MKIAAAIVAGGKGRRMGHKIKALIEVDGQSILRRQLAVLESRTSAIAIAANDEAPFTDFALPVLADPVIDAGPLAGLCAALDWSPTEHVLVVACDMPNLSGAVLDELIRRVEVEPTIDALIPVRDGRPEPLLAIYSRRFLPLALSRLHSGQRALRDLADRAIVAAAGLRLERLDAQALAPFDPELRAFTNINRPDDLP